MNISITFRQMDTSDAIKQYATDKVAKLQRFLRRPMTAKVTVSLDRRKHVVEARISSGSEHLEAHEVTDDMYASIDQVMDKLERQIRGSKGTARARRRDSDSLKETEIVKATSARVAAPRTGARQAPAARRSTKTSGRPKERASKSR
jgi:putative sigma-54 modulation protein